MSRQTKKAERKKAVKGKKAKKISLLKQKRRNYGNEREVVVGTVTAKGMAECSKCGQNYHLDDMYRDNGLCTRVIGQPSNWYDDAIRCRGKIVPIGLYA